MSQLMDPHSFESEQSVIGGMIIACKNADHDRISSVMKLVKPESFYSTIHQTIFRSMIELIRNDKPVDLVTLQAHLDKSGDLERIGGFAYLIEIVKVTPSAANIVAYAKQVREHAVRRYAMRKVTDALEMLSTKTSDPLEDQMAAVQGLLAEITDYASSGRVSGFRHIREFAEKWMDEVEARTANPTANAGYTSGIPSLDKILYPKLIRRGSLVVIGARPKMGKEQPLHSKILLANGMWTTMGEIRIGDELASVDGQPSLVTGIFPQGRKTTYRVSFSDGRSAECGIDHLWTIRSSRFKGDRTVTTSELKVLMEKPRLKGRLTVPSMSGDFGSTTDLGIDPWLLGVLLGDGCLTGATPKVSCSEQYIIDGVKESLPHGISMNLDSGIDYRISGVKGKSNPVTEALKTLGVYGFKSCDKHIPEVVFSAPRQIRERVLAGLLETDGWCEKHNSLMFSSASARLADGVQRLVRSLGGCAKIRIREGVTYTAGQDVRSGMNSHIVGIRLLDNSIIKSPRILENLKPSKRSSTPYITSIEVSGEAECQCIMVNHESHLYITDDYVVTHNTAFLLRILLHFALTHKLPVGMFSLEMPGMELWERMVSQESRVNSDKFYTGMSDADFGMVSNAMGPIINSNMMVCDDTKVSLATVMSEGRKLKAKHGKVGCIAVDYLTLMAAEKADRNDLAYGMITKGLKNLAKELDCPVFLLTQLNRQLESRSDKRPMPSDSRDTGQIEQDCDLWVGLYRDGVYNKELPPGLTGVTEAIVRLNRHGKSGTAFMNLVDGAFYDADQQQIGNMMMAESNSNNGEDY